MDAENQTHMTARIAGAALLATILIGIISAVTVSSGIDINMTADVEATSRAMLDAEIQLRAKAYLGLLIKGFEWLFLIAVYRLLRGDNPLLAGWVVFVGIGASVLSLQGVVAAVNAAELAGTAAYTVLANEDQRLLLAALQATTDYTSFHLSLVLGSVANAGVFVMFLRSGGLPKLLSAWGVFASLFVAAALVARDFIPAFGGDTVTAAFMVSNLIALIATSLYLCFRGVRASPVISA